MRTDHLYLFVCKMEGHMTSVLTEMSSVNPRIGKCSTVCSNRVQWQNMPGNNVTDFTKSHDFNSMRLAN